MKYPKTAPLCDLQSLSVVDEIEHILSQALPPEDVYRCFEEKLPLITWTPLGEPPFTLTFFLCCRSRPNAYRFFYELMSRWLIPGKRMNVLIQFATDFTLPEISDQIYLAGELMVRIETPGELRVLEKQLPIIETELRLGIESAYHANRILEIKGLTPDEKSAMIQENVVQLIKRRPQDFDYDILSDVQHFLVLCKDSFKAARSFKHLSRIIGVHYLFRKALRLSLEIYSERRYISVKLVRTRPHLGIAIGMSFLRDHEVFEARHILAAVKSVSPKAQIVPDSFFQNGPRSDPVRTIYIEVQQPGGFTLEEIKQLQETLPVELRCRIECRLNPVFMPQNEEEIMRSIVALSGQLRLVRDLPQVVITFCEQTEDALAFQVIVVRVLSEGCRPIAELFEHTPTYLEFLLDRVKKVGMIRKKYVKEATVFRVRVGKAPFLRRDQSVDLCAARQDVAKEVRRVMGEFRDYNGGTLSKETELLTALRSGLSAQGEEEGFVLENFFYNLQPPMMRSVLPPKPLKKLFNLLMEAQTPGMHVEEDEEYLYLVFLSEDPFFKEEVEKALATLDLPPLDLATSFVEGGVTPALALLYRGKERRALRQLENLLGVSSL